MADIVLKDRNGNDIQYPGITNIKVNTVDGETAEFVDSATIPESVENIPIALDFSGGNQMVSAPDGTVVKSAIIEKPNTLIPGNIAEGVDIAGITGTLTVPESLENIPIALDFSEGDQTIIAPDGMAVKSAIIQKPKNLLPENVAEGVDIAGIIGTLAAGGGGGSCKLAWGTLAYTGAVQTITHDLGVLPDVIIVFELSNVTGSNSTIRAIYGLSEAFVTKTGSGKKSVKYVKSSTYNFSQSQYNGYFTNATATGYLHGADENVFKVPKELDSMITYFWCAIAGLT